MTTLQKPTMTYRRPKLYPKQEQAIFSNNRYAVIEGSTKSGKTVACLTWLLEQAILGKDGNSFWWVAPVYGQAKMAFRRMKRGLPKNSYTNNESELTITLPNGAIIAGTYKVRVGAGGTATYAGTHATKGDWSFFGPTGTADWPTHVMAEGGGSGGCYSSNGGWSAGANGGGASGESSYPNPQQAPNSPAPTAFGTSVSKSGADGGGGDNWGTCPDCRLGGGGGGQAGNGGPANPGPATGGAGFQYQIAGDPNNNYYYGGGGGGGAWGQSGGVANGGHNPFSAGAAGIGGGGGGGSSQISPGGGKFGNGGASARNSGLDGSQGANSSGGDGGANTGGGGGGNGQSNYVSWPGPTNKGGAGGPGIVVIAYPTP